MTKHSSSSKASLSDGRERNHCVIRNLSQGHFHAASHVYKKKFSDNEIRYLKKQLKR
jgi:hypothetical protein